MSDADKTPVFDVSKIPSQEALADFEKNKDVIVSLEDLTTNFVPEQEKFLIEDTQSALNLLNDVEIPENEKVRLELINESAKAILAKTMSGVRRELEDQPIQEHGSIESVDAGKTPQEIGSNFEQTQEYRESDKLVYQFNEATKNLFDRQLIWLENKISMTATPERKLFLMEWKQRLENRIQIIQKLENGKENPEKTITINKKTLNKIFRVDVGEQTGAFKPASGESVDMADTYGFERYQAYRREWLASQINDVLGLDVVPPTVVRNTEHGIGSLQQWQNAEPDTNLTWENSTSVTKNRDLEEISVLHFVTDQADGHYGNVMLDVNGRLKSFDNGISFGSFDSIAHSEALMRNGFDLTQASQAVVKIYKSETRPQLKSAPMLELMEDPTKPFPLSENIQENIQTFLEDSTLQRGIRDCFDVSFGDDSGKKFGEFLRKLTELSDNGLPPYKYPGKRRK